MRTGATLLELTRSNRGRAAMRGDDVVKSMEKEAKDAMLKKLSC